MALLTVDKIEQLRTQLQDCTNHQTVAALKIAIARLESQISPTDPSTSDPQRMEEMLLPLIAQGNIKVYHPSR